MRADGRVGVEVYRDIREEPGSPVTAARIVAELLARSDEAAVVLTRAGTARATTALVQGENILSASSDSSAGGPGSRPCGGQPEG